MPDKKIPPENLLLQKSLEDILLNSSEVHYIHDSEGVIHYISPQCKKYFGYEPEEMKVKWTELLSDNPKNLEGIEITRKAIRTRKKQPPYFLEFKRRDGKLLWVEVLESPLFDERGKLLGVTGSLRDVSVEKKALENLESSRERYMNLVNNMNQLVVELNEKGEFSFLTGNHFGILGYQPSELIGTKVIELLHQEDYERAKYQFRDLKSEKNPVVSILRFQHKNGHYLSFQCYSSVYTDKQGVMRIVVVSHDITENLETRKALDKQNQLLEEAELLAGLGHWEIDLNNGTVWGSKGAEKIYGIKGELFALNYIQSMSLPEYRNMLDKSLEDLVKNGKDYHLRFKIKRKKTGEILDIESIANYNKEENKVFGTLQDITARVKIEEELNNAVRKQTAIIEKNPVPMVVTNPNQDILIFNAKFTEVFGYTLNDIKTIEQWWLSAFPNPEYREMVMKDWTLATEKIQYDNYGMEKRVWDIACKNGRIKTCEFHMAQIGDTYVISMMDLTEIKLAEKALIESETTYRSLVDNSQSGILFVDPEGYILRANPRYLEITGMRSLKNVLGSNIFSLNYFHNRDIQRIFELCMDTGQVKNLDFSINVLGADIVYISLYMVPVYNEEIVAGVLINIDDVTETVQAKMELEESERKLRLSMEASGSGIFEINLADGNSIFNDEFINHLGYNRDEFKNNLDNWINLIHPDEKIQVKKHLSKYVESKNPKYHNEYRIRKKDGEYLWLLVRGELVSRDKNGAPHILTGIMTDITMLKEYQEKIVKQAAEITSQNEEYASLNEELQSNLNEKMQINENLEKTTHNLMKSESRAKRLLEETRKRNREISMLLGGAREILGSEDFAKTSQKLSKYCKDLTGSESGYIGVDSGSNEVPEILFLDNNAEKNLSVSDSLKSIGELKNKVYRKKEVLFINDFPESDSENHASIEDTGIKNILMAPLVVELKPVGFIVLQNKPGGYTNGDKNLVGAFAELIALAYYNADVLENLRAAKNKAEESDKLKSAFLSNMSHEIRTPMNAILGFSDLLLKKDLVREKRNHFSRMIHNSSEQLMMIINDIIDISKIESNQLSIFPEWIDLGTFMEELLLNTRQTKIFKESSAKLEFLTSDCKEKLLIYADRNRLMQIFNNLLSNALKFTSDGYVHFGCEFLKEKDGNLYRFYVKDTGIGIPAGSQEQIFNRFVQADNLQMVQGTGLGLSITKGLVELMGGEIGVESEYGKGSLFYFTIPQKENITIPVIHDEVGIESKSPSLEQFLIYIAEDDLPSYNFIAESISDTKIRTKHFTNGLELVNTVKSDPPDIILMDINMPLMNGIEATREIRKMGLTIPVIAQTAYAMSNERQKCIDAGCDEYISKPLKTELLVKIITEKLADNQKN